MAVEPKELVDYAYDILSNSDQEVEWRNAINRAYYGAFLCAREKSGMSGNRSKSVHKQVADYYKNRSSTIYNRLTDMCKMRNYSDYKPRNSVPKRDASACCKNARGVIQELSKPIYS
ncbi:hypothetical protein OAE19_04810 [Porticoccaceae bacterium]|nr:hypothetical protein [Porticoccaceae bacterium]